MLSRTIASYSAKHCIKQGLAFRSVLSRRQSPHVFTLIHSISSDNLLPSMSESEVTKKRGRRGKHFAKDKEIRKEKATKPSVPTSGKPATCTLCGAELTSKTKLFKHLEEEHGLDNGNVKPEKVVVLFGWKSLHLDDTEVWVKETNDIVIKDEATSSIETELSRAISTFEKASPEELENGRLKGFSRASSCSQRASHALGMENSNHACCDTICFQSTTRWRGQETIWLDGVNALLPAHLRVLSRVVLPSFVGELNAEQACTQRRFEYIIPLSVIMPKELAVPPEEPIVRQRKYKDEKSNKGADSNEVKHLSMDQEFPADTPEGQARIAFFRRLKEMLKCIIGRQPMHNFTTGGGCPEEATPRKIDRFFHKDIVELDGEKWVVFSITGNSFQRGQVRHLMGLALAVMRGWLPRDYVEDALCKDGLVEVPPLPGFMCYLAECRFAYFEAAHWNLRLDPRRDISASRVGAKSQEEVAEVDAEGRNSSTPPLQQDDTLMDVEEKPQPSTQPVAMRSADAESREDCFKRIESWQMDIQKYIVNIYRERYPGDDGEHGWVKDFESKCRQAAERHAALCRLTRRQSEQLQDMLPVVDDSHSSKRQRGQSSGADSSAGIQGVMSSKDLLADGSAGCSEVRGAREYRRVLHLLRQADASGKWPNTSIARSRVIHELSDERKEGKIEAGISREEESVEATMTTMTAPQKVEAAGEAPQLKGGSFSVGALPKGLTQPKGNELFPDLMKACFELEMAICPPGRAPSATIAINRHAQFLPHRDSGIGNGQSTSLIVALGDFSGGELVVETTANDIRYTPLEFDGWSQRHWTLPFAGERYSLVWFTPSGVEPDDLWWWKDIDARQE